MKIKHVKGNVLRLEIPLTIKRKELVDGRVEEHVEDFYPCSDYPTYINFKKSLTIPFEASVQDNIARMQDDGTLNVGTYQIEVMCCDEAGNPYRYMVRDIIEVVDATADADIEEGVEFNAETYTLEGAVFISYGVEQVQADWAQTDDTAVDYIKNKPDLGLYLQKKDDDGHGNMSIHSPGNLVMTLTDEQGSVNQIGTFYAGGWSVSSPDGKFQTSGNSIYRGTMGFDHDSVVWEKTAAQQIPAATTEKNGLMSAEDKGKLSDLPTNEQLTEELGYKADSADLAKVARSGSYNDLTDKPTIPAAQVQSDWNETNTVSKAYILNKPTIPTLPTNVSAFNNDAGYLTEHQNITGKADKVSNPTNGNFAALDSNGNLTDSGHKHSDYLTEHQSLNNYVQKSNTQGLLKNDGTIDTTQYLTQHQDISGKANKNEMSVVPGTGVNADKTTISLKKDMSVIVLTTHQDITGKENTMPITTATGETLTAVVGNYYRLDNVSTLVITLPTIVGATKLQAITFLITCGLSALVKFVPQGSETILKQEGFALEDNTTYEVTALWNGSEWTLSRVIYE